MKPSQREPGTVIERSCADGIDTIKITITAPDRAVYECSAFVNAGLQRLDLSLSSMAGCAMGCVMCSATHSSIPFQRKLTAEEIVDQADELMRAITIDGAEAHLGFFGDGESLANFVPVTKAVRTICAKPWNIVDVTISTTGMPNGKMEDLTEFALTLETELYLQVSLYSLDPVVRKSLLPLARPLDSGIEELDEFARQTGNPVRYNWPIIPGLNDHRKAANDLAGFIRSAPDLRRVKLSRIFAVPGSPVAPTNAGDIAKFARALEEKGIATSIFLGDDETNDRDAVHASCGQLRSL